jgi:uncharacterized membrane protein
LYGTRWITNFCAPTFVFLTGTSAWMQFLKGKDTRTLSGFLLKRGLWLIILEATAVNFGWTLALSTLTLLGVIWAIGWSMIALAALVWLPRQTVLVIGLGIIAGHNLLDPVLPEHFGSHAWLWMFLHEGGPLLSSGGVGVFLAYPVLPWIGVIALGYGMGAVFQMPQRDRVFSLVGLGTLLLFFILRGANVYGDPHPWVAQAGSGKTIMAFLNVMKYPPSLLYTCATLGPMFLVIPVLERLRGVPAEVLRTYGAVPLFFYVLHLYVLHALAILVRLATGKSVEPLFDVWVTWITHPERIGDSHFPLWVTYGAWTAALIMLYPLCRKWGDLKRTRRDWWLSYL